MDRTKIICNTIAGIVTTLVIGEAIAGVVSRPLGILRAKSCCNVDVDMLNDAMNDFERRITDLENPEEGEA